MRHSSVHTARALTQQSRSKVKMAYNRDNYVRIKAEYEDKNLAAKNAAEARVAMLSLEHPDIAAIDRELSLTGVRILKAASSENSASELEELKARITALREKKTALLVGYGYPADYLDVRYECAECSDTGYVGSSMCKCFKRALVMAGYESSGIGALIRRQSFDNFSLDYYAEDKKTLEQMKKNYAVMRSYAQSFDTSTVRNMLIVGGTGVGKTHLTTAMAKEVIDRGFDVLYESAPNIFFELEQERFSREGEERKIDRYYSAELLIIDDLGTESITQYSVACLYNILNTRLNKGVSTVINTNLMPDALYKKYTDRIASRLLGEYATLHFVGTDIRMQKLKHGK